MATTTNYSWSTPDDTALVKDGAAAIRSLGTAIDTTVFTNAGAAINKTIVDAKGDLIVASGADAVARLAVGGTNGHVLTVNSGATNGVEWAAVSAGGMTLLSTTTLSGTTTSITSISGSYKNLQMVITGITSSTGDDQLTLAMNASATAHQFNVLNDNSNYRNSGAKLNINYGSGLYRTGAANAFVVNIINYASTTTMKPITWGGGYTNNPTLTALQGAGMYSSTSAITSIDVGLSGQTMTGGTVLLYGVN